MSRVDPERFGGIARLYGAAALPRLAMAHVVVVGVGGVGAWTVEALARSGIGRLTLIDGDDVCVTNTNRQLPALEGEIGRPKVVVLAERMRRINPCLEIHPVTEFFLESNSERLLAGRCDWIVDAVDRMSIKSLLLARARERALPVLTVGGAGGRLDPTQVRCAPLSRSGGDALLRQVRRKLRRDFGWTADDLDAVPAIFSAEPQRFPTPEGGVCLNRGEATDHLRMDCASGYGAATFVTGTFGFVAAAEIVRRLAGMSGTVT
ncbi:MAG TPA: tRNA threonylcarbamoyladenosine dehydratase [Chthoniobacteraceae bacterium]|nr:tRNA threonylcarbamoyladenosine dehydratase [Chthoniobacteraceae bacterium]